MNHLLDTLYASPPRILGWFGPFLGGIALGSVGCDQTATVDSGGTTGTTHHVEVEPLIIAGPLIDPVTGQVGLPRLATRASFSERGVELRDPRRSRTPGLRVGLVGAAQGNHALDLRVKHSGLGDCLDGPTSTPGGACPRPFQVAREDLHEWWVVGDTAIEQGFVIPHGHPSGGPLRLDLSVDGASHVQAMGDGAWIQLGWGRGWSVAAPVAWDATGRPLSATLEVRAAGLRLWVDPAGAEWPVTIDPIYATAAQVLYPTETWSTSSAYSSVWPYLQDHDEDGYDDLLYSAAGSVLRGGWAGLAPDPDLSYRVASITTNLLPRTNYFQGRTVGFDVQGDFDGDGLVDQAREVRLNHATYRINSAGQEVVDTLEYLGSNVVITSFARGAAGLTTPWTALRVSEEDEQVTELAALDANGDGYSDLLVNLSAETSDGVARWDLYLGGPAGMETSPVWTRADAEVGTLARASHEERMGDIDGDGYEDLVFVWPLTDELVVIPGSSGGLDDGGELTLDLNTIGDFGSFSAFGPVGDYTGDGVDDLAVIEAGAVRYLWVIPGGAGGLDLNAAYLHDFEMGGVSELDILGDLSADGNPELFGFGGAILRFGDPLTDAPSSTVLAYNDYETVGSSVNFSEWAAHGDVNGDGVEDVVVSQADVVGRLLVFNGTCTTDLDGDQVCAEFDCDDQDPTLGHELTVWYADLDLDGLGGGEPLATGCAPPEGAVDNADDCDDNTDRILGPTVRMRDRDEDDFHNGTGRETCAADDNVAWRSGALDCRDDHATFTDSCSALAIARRSVGVRHLTVGLTHYRTLMSPLRTDTPVRMRYSNTSTRPVRATGYLAGVFWRLSSGSDGLRTVYGWYTYPGGTILGPITDTVYLDRVVPTDGAVSLDLGREEVFMQISGFADEGSGLGGYVLTEGVREFPPDCDRPAIWSGSDVETDILLQDLVNAEHHYYRLCAEDNAGNYSAGIEVEAWAAEEAEVPTLDGGLVDETVEWTDAETVAVWLSAEDESGVPLMCVNLEESCRLFSPYAESADVVLPRTDGEVDVYLHVRDGNGNPARVGPFVVGVDVSPPIDGVVSATPIPGGVALSWEAAEDEASGVQRYEVFRGVASAPDCGGDSPVYSGSDLSVQVEGLRSGNHYFRVCAIDALGHVSRGATVRATAGNETNIPTGSLSSPGGDVVRSRMVTLGLEGVDDTGVTRMCLGETLPCTRFVAYSPSPRVTLSLRDGAKTVHAVLRDTYGNESEPISLSLTLDTTAPVDGLAALERGDGFLSLSWEVATDALSGLSGYRVVRLEGATPAARCATGDALTPTDERLLVDEGLTNGNTYTYRVCAVDVAGNVSAGVVVTGRPSADREAPVGTMTLAEGAEWTNATEIDVALEAVDESVVTDMCVGLSTSCTWVPFVPSLRLSLGSGDGVKTVYARFRDEWGNESDPVTGQIGRDRVAPTGGTLVGTPGTGRVELAWSGFSDARSGVASYRVVAASGSTSPTNCLSGESVYAGVDNSVVLPRTAGTWSFRACAVDAAGNLSAGVTRRVTITE